MQNPTAKPPGDCEELCLRHGLLGPDTYLLAPVVSVGQDGWGILAQAHGLLLSTRGGTNLGSHLYLPPLGEALAK